MYSYFSIQKNAFFPRLLMVTVTGLLFFGLVSAQKFPSGRLTDEELYNRGKQYYETNDYTSAAVYLYAFLQRKPSHLNKAKFRNDLYAALDYSLQRSVANGSSAGLDAKFDKAGQNVYNAKPSLSNSTDTKPGLKIQSIGHWICSDGGTYYLHQIGNEVWWFGQSPGANTKNGFANVMHGYIDEEEHKTNGKWADIPLGSTGNWGEITLYIEGPNKLRMISQSGGFSGTQWTAMRSIPGINELIPKFLPQ